jgi:hypothetical protein
VVVGEDEAAVVVAVLELELSPAVGDGSVVGDALEVAGRVDVVVAAPVVADDVTATSVAVSPPPPEELPPPAAAPVTPVVLRRPSSALATA